MMQSSDSTDMHNVEAKNELSGRLILWATLVAFAISGCATMDSDDGGAVSETGVQRVRQPDRLDFEQVKVLLQPLGLEEVARVPEAEKKTILLKGMRSQRRRAELILDIADANDPYCIEILGPASVLRGLPSNAQIAAALGDIDIGTFDEPPEDRTRSRALIDMQGESTVALLPVRYRGRLHALLGSQYIAQRSGHTVAVKGSDDVVRTQSTPVSDALALLSPPSGTERGTEPNDALHSDIVAHGQNREAASGPKSTAEKPATGVILSERATPSESRSGSETVAEPAEKVGDKAELPKTVKMVFPAVSNRSATAETRGPPRRTAPNNANDVLTLTLPETITVIQLLDLVGKHVGLNYVYDPREINNQQITLKLHGNLQGEMTVGNLYALMETVLDSMGLAMIRQDDDLVAVVPVEKALQKEPKLVDVENSAVQVGDTIVTRVFEIRYIDIASVMALLETMKLSVTVTALDKANLLLVTCQAGRMSRVERLVEMIDRPGAPMECRFRRLQYVTASSLITKVRAVAEEFGGIAVATAPGTPAPPSQPARPPTAPKASTSVGRRPVYLDTDDRTNRILMIGSEDELNVLEELIDILDVIQEDLRSPRVYAIEHLDAGQVVEKLRDLDVLRAPLRRAAGGEQNAGATAKSAEEPLVVVLEATNQLLVNATADQHDGIRKFLSYIDVVPEDFRTIAAYPLQHIDAHAAGRTLEELELVSGDTRVVSGADPNLPVFARQPQRGAAKTTESLTHVPLVVVSKSTNALLVKATPEQHAQIAKVVKYIDTEAPHERHTYEIYPLKSSSPEHLADLLQRLIGETVEDPEAKIVRPGNTPERITIVPDPNTFSLIVYANQKNQTWMEELITRLDKRRPQVLIDVTLVEITRTDTFEYDLNLVANANDAVVGNVVIDAIQGAATGSRLEAGFNLLDQDGNPTGQTKAFYSDQKVQALLTAIQRKNYGRVLAKPKVLVDDGQKGEIITRDETTYVKESIQIPQVGAPITTREFVPIEASIQLQITPHISEGSLLRLDVHLSRDDFGSRPISGAPPDKATSEVTTTVFVPHDRTVILGGLVKLNQSKGGSKVPLLGDVPIVGGLFRSIDNSDIEKKLYVFLKANIVRPYDEARLMDLQAISEEHATAFEKSEAEFQALQGIPGIAPKPMPPKSVLRDYK